MPIQLNTRFIYFFLIPFVVWCSLPQVDDSTGSQPPMQRCPYIHEMRERFITEQPRQVYIMNRIDRERDRVEREGLLSPKQSSAISDASSNQVGTVVKV